MRKLFFWSHLLAALTAGVLILVMSLTGVLLTYERQLIAWSDRAFRSAPPSADAPPLPVSALLDEVALQTEARVTAVTRAADRTAPVSLAIPRATLYADAYSGRILGEGTRGVREAMSTLRAWHRWLAVEGENRPLARALTGWANVLFLFVVLSGLYIWFPRTWTWKHVRAVTLFRGGLHGKARDFNWHNVIGLWSAVPLAIVVASAVPISFPWANAAIYHMVGDEPPQPAGRGAAAGATPASARAGRGRGAGVVGRGGQAGDAPGGTARESQARGDAPRGRDGGAGEPRTRAAATLEGLDQLWARASQQEPEWRTIRMAIPNGLNAPVVFTIDRGDGGQPHLRSTLTLARDSGAQVSYDTFSNLTLGRRIRNGMRFAHTGELLGVPGQTIAGLVTGGSLVLVWTGFALTWRRFRAWLARRSARRASASYPTQPGTTPFDPVIAASLEESRP